MSRSARECGASPSMGFSVTDRMAFLTRAVVPWRPMVAAALLSLLLGAAVSQGLTGERSSVVPDAHSRVALGQRLSSLPLSAQGPVSEALGANDPGYRISAHRGGFRAASPEQRLVLRFARSGVSLSSGAARLRLSLLAVGYGSSLRAVGDLTPRVKANRVLYARAGLSEWYVNGPLGLEQGFTLPRAPSGHPHGPLTLSMALSGNVHASLTATGQSLMLTRAGEPVLRYSGLSATDARGHALHTWLQLHAGMLLLRVDTRGARYPLRIDPLIQQGEKLTGSGEIGKGFFGYHLALSSDGNTALIGGERDTGYVGAAWVFTRSGSTWTQQGAKLTGSGESGNGVFGDSVALSSDGNTALIGGPGDNGDVGAAWVFTRSGSTWTQQGAKLTGSGEIGKGFFGESAALSSDGNTALIGGLFDNGEVGAAWVFVNPPSSVTTTTTTTTGTATTTATATPTPPVLANAAQSNRSWREGKRLASFSRKHKLPPLGTTFSFTLNEQARVSFTFTQQVGGRKVNGRCVAQSKKNRRKHACKRTLTRGTLSFTGHAGTNKVSFQGRISHSKKLGLGSYTLVITATNAAGQHSSTKQLSFTIVK